LNDDKITREFKLYLDSSKYEYESDLEKRIVEVVKHLKENHNVKKMENTLEKLKSEIDEMFEIEFKENLNEILEELRIELAYRFNGTDGGMKERLKYDLQFTTALNVLMNEEAYSKLLNNKIKN
jgi:hypothetical protein